MRAPREACLLNADNDYSAICEWLEKKFKNRKNSFEQYKIQSERLLLWAIIEKQKPISSFNTDDFIEYFNFLDSPAEQWCMERGRGGIKRYDKDWRPFTGPLSPSSKATAINSINTMLNYWEKFGYIRANVLHMIDIQEYQMPKQASRLKVVERALTTSEWQAIIKAISAKPAKKKVELQEVARIKFLLYTLLITALRREEIVNLKWSHFGRLRNTWRLEVIGKGNKPALLVLPDRYIEMANVYRSKFDMLPLNDNCDDNESSPVFFSLKTSKPLTGNYINRKVKEAALDAVVFIDDELSKKRLSQVSAHWIRHTAATVLDDAGVNKDIIQTHLRHNSIATTDLYIHKNAEDIKLALDALMVDCK